MKLSEAQVRRLREIEAYRPDASFPAIGFWKSWSTDRSLLKRGLIEAFEHRTKLGGGGAVGQLQAVFTLCRITPAGRRALEDQG